MSNQFDRACSLIIGAASGDALDLSALRIRFTVTQATVQTPKHADIRVYNPNPETAKRIQREFTKVALQAGYAGAMGLIFQGTVKQIRRGRENATDTYLDILAADSDQAYNFAVVSQTMAAGATQSMVKDALVKSMKPFGITEGYAPAMSQYQLPRGKVLFGMARDHLRTLAKTNGVDWSLTDGQLQLAPIAAPLPGEAIVLTAKTGLIGLPTQTINGILAKVLLNPQIRAGKQVRIDNESIQDAQVSPGIDIYSQYSSFPQKDADGFYKVFFVQHIGDTRGQAWYSDLICTAVDGTAPLTSVYLNAVTSNGR